MVEEINVNQLDTLGGKEKLFEWEYIEHKGIVIKKKVSKKYIEIIFTDEDINKVLEFINNNGDVDLANSVTKMRDGTEKNGIGSFIYENLYRNETIAQASSQLVAILFKKGILGYNGKKRGMRFWLIDENWRALLRN
jgi:hypothetical protein